MECITLDKCRTSNLTCKTQESKQKFHIEFNSIQHSFINTCIHFLFLFKYCLKENIIKSKQRKCENLLGKSRRDSYLLTETKSNV